MAEVAELESHLESGEALRYHAAIRHGGRVGVTDARVMVMEAAETTSVHLETIDEVTIQSFDYYLGLLSAVVVGFGILSFERSVIGGALFVAFGLGSLYWSYRKRGQVQLHLRGRRKAVTFSIDDTDAFEAALGRAIDRYEARVHEGGAG